jgi:hypothetical protein
MASLVATLCAWEHQYFCANGAFSREVAGSPASFVATGTDFRHVGSEREACRLRH